MTAERGLDRSDTRRHETFFPLPNRAAEMEKSAKLLSKNGSIPQIQYARRVAVTEMKSISLDGTAPGESPEGTAWGWNSEPM